jgi:hypothetical protein
VGTAFKSKLFSTSAIKRLPMETHTKKKIVFSMSEARRLLSLAKPEKWKLFGKILQKINVYGVQMAISEMEDTKLSLSYQKKASSAFLQFDI